MEVQVLSRAHFMSDIYYAVAHRSEKEIKSFTSRYDDFDETAIPRIFELALSKKVISWSRSKSWGSSHVIYFVHVDDLQEELVLRANTGINVTPEKVMVIESLITKEVSRLGLKTNEILHVDVSRSIFPFDFQIQRKLLGKDPEIEFKGSKEEYGRLSYQLGEYIARYHELQFPLFGRFDEQTVDKGILQGIKASAYEYLQVCLNDDLSKLVVYQVIDEKTKQVILNFFDEHKKLLDISKGVLNHHDLADHNLLFDESGLVGVFDWEAAVVTDPTLDLASCPTWRTLYPRENELLAGYQSVRPLPENFQKKKEIYFLRTMIWKMVYAIRMNILNSERKARFEQALKAISF